MLAMRCENCDGRWVALTHGSTITARTVSYHFDREAVQCPRCGAEGIVDPEVLNAHQRHPYTVASHCSTLSRQAPPPPPPTPGLGRPETQGRRRRDASHVVRDVDAEVADSTARIHREGYPYAPHPDDIPKLPQSIFNMEKKPNS